MRAPVPVSPTSFFPQEKQARTRMLCLALTGKVITFWLPCCGCYGSESTLYFVPSVCVWGGGRAGDKNLPLRWQPESKRISTFKKMIK